MRIVTHLHVEAHMAKPAIIQRESLSAGLAQLGLNLTIIDHPITIPTVIRAGRRGAGTYAQILNSALKLKPTTMDSGLAPHFEWPCDSKRQLRTRMMGLQGTKRRNKGTWDHIFFMQRVNDEENKFHIYIWNEGH